MSDGQGGSATATVSVNVTAVNDAPVALDDAFITPENTPVTLNLLGNDSDVDGDIASLKSINGTVITPGLAQTITVSGGSVSVSPTGVVTFAPQQDYNGPVNFDYVVKDDKGGEGTGRVSVSVTSVNNVPVANPDTVTTPEDRSLTLTAVALLGNDTDVDGNPLTIISVQSPAGGTVALVGGQVVFTPTANYNGPASFTYTVSDGQGGVSTATVSVNVTPVNDVPVAGDDLSSTAVNSPINNINILGNDRDVDGDTLTVTRATVDPLKGTVSINPDGTLNFTPALNVSGPVQITYTISDGKGGTDTAVLTVNVGNNTPPDSADRALTTAEDTPLTLTVGNFTFTDADAGQTLVNVRIDSAPTNGTLRLDGATVAAGQVISVADLAAGKVSFAPALNGNGVNYASFNFSVQDSGGAFDTVPNTITVDVTAVNDAPVANPDTVTTAEDTPLSLAPGALLGNDTDVDGNPLSISSVQAPVGGTVAIVGGQVVFTPTANYNGPASFTYTVSDGQGGSATATVSVNVTAVNDAPVASNDVRSTPINTPLTSVVVLGNDRDVDGDTLTVVGASVDPLQGSVTVNPDGTLNVTPASNVSGPVQVTYTISDGNGGSATAQLTISVGVGNPPDSAAKTITTAEDTSVTLLLSDFEFTDADAGQTFVGLRVDSLPGNGVLLINGMAVTSGQLVSVADISSGKLTFNPALNENGGNYASFNFSVQDSSGTFDVAPNTITFNVTAMNDVPVATPDTVTTAEDIPLTLPSIALLGNDTDVDGNLLSISSAQTPVGGTVAIVDGQVVFTPTPNYNGPASFTYTVIDGQGGRATATVSVNVTPVSDLPTADLKHDSTNDTGGSINDSITANPSPAITGTGAPGDTITLYAVDGITVLGTALVDAAGIWSIDPTINYLSEGPNLLSVRATDPAGNQSSAVPVLLTLDTAAPLAPTVVVTEDANNDRLISAAELSGSVDVRIGLPADVKVGDTLTVTDGTTINTFVLTTAQIATGNVTTSFANPGEGNTISVTARITDVAGNTGANSPVDSALVDTTAPSVLSGALRSVEPDDSGTLGDSITSNRSPAITGTGNVGDTITLYAADGVTVLGTALVNATGNWSIDPASNYLSEGLNALSVRATDPAGNQGPALPVVITLDTTAPSSPSVVVTEDTNNDGLISALELSGLVDVRVGLPADATAGDTLTVTDGTTTRTFVLTTAQLAAGNVTTSFVSPGQGNTISVSARVIDVAGNLGGMSATDSAAIDTRVPLAVQDVLVTRESTPLVIDFATLLQNDIGAVERPLVITSVQGASNGTVAIVDGKIVFTPNANYFGPASFTYTVSDGLGSTSTATVNVAIQTFDPLPIESERFVEVPAYVPPRAAVNADPALHVLYSVNDVRVDTGLRAGMGIFQTDSVTMAELSSEQALALDNLTAPRGFDGLDESHLLGNGIGAQNALFVQHAVRHEALVSEVGLFVQNSVRASQLESLARNIRVDTFNSAISGVDTLLDPFALGSPAVSPVTPLAEALEKERQNTPTSKLEKENSLQANNAVQVAEPARTLSTADDFSVTQVKRRAADGFATQLRRNATAFRTSALRPETPLAETKRVTR